MIIVKDMYTLSLFLHLDSTERHSHLNLIMCIKKHAFLIYDFIVFDDEVFVIQ